MNPFRRMVTVCNNTRVFVYNRRPTEREEMAKWQLEGDMQHDAWYWHRVLSNPPPGCLCRLWWSASTLTEPFRPDGNVFLWCTTILWFLYWSLLTDCFSESNRHVYKKFSAFRPGILYSKLINLKTTLKSVRTMCGRFASGLQSILHLADWVLLILATKCIPKLAQSQPSSESLH